MKRYPCHSRLIISCREIKGSKSCVTVRLKHHVCHVDYTDVSMPVGAIEMMREHVEWMTPVAMVAKVQAAFPGVTATQVHAHWLRLSQPLWWRDDLQLHSASKLLKEYNDVVDVFEPVGIPEGIEMLCWGMKKIVAPLQGSILEIGLDATCEH